MRERERESARQEDREMEVRMIENGERFKSGGVGRGSERRGKYTLYYL